jgi:hypothetical protein
MDDCRKSRTATATPVGPGDFLCWVSGPHVARTGRRATGSHARHRRVGRREQIADRAMQSHGDPLGLVEANAGMALLDMENTCLVSPIAAASAVWVITRCARMIDDRDRA